MVTKQVASTTQSISSGKQTRIPHKKTEWINLFISKSILFNFIKIMLKKNFSLCLLHYRNSKKSRSNDIAVSEVEAELFLAKTIQSMEEKMNEPLVQDNNVGSESTAEGNVGSGNASAVLKKI